MMTNVRRQLGWTLVASSLALHLLTVFAFARQPDRLAAFTVMPIWVWGGVGLLLSSVAFYFLRASLSLILTGIWAVTILLGADEARVLGNLAKEIPLPGQARPFSGLPVQCLADAVDIGVGPVGDLIVAADAERIQPLFNQHANAAHALEIILTRV